MARFKSTLRAVDLGGATSVQKKSSTGISAEDFSRKRIPAILSRGRLGRCFLGASRRISGGSWSFGGGGTCLILCRRSGGGGSCRRSDSFGFLFTSREKRGTGQNADVFLHSWRRILL